MEEEAEEREPERWQGRRMWPNNAGFEDGGRCPRAKKWGKLLETRKGKEAESTLEPPEGT